MESLGGRAILLTGMVGTGKTTIAVELGELLDEREVPHAVIDLDWLAWLRPADGSRVTHEQVLTENLRAIWPTFRRAGVDRFVLARYLRGHAEVESMRSALSGVELFVVALSAPRDVLEERLRRRDTGAQLAEHLEAICAADALVEGGGADCGVESHGRPAREIAVEIAERAGWRE